MNLDIAHIEALNPGGPRYRDEMTDKERNSFWNLLLLCRPHHRHVDEDEARFEVAILKDWKRQAEVDIDQAELEVFRGLTEGKFEGIMRGVIQQHAIQVKSALEVLVGLGQEQSRLLRDVVNRLDDSQLAGGYIDADQVSLLNGAAAKLERSLNEDNVALFSEAARAMDRNFNEDTVFSFHQAVQDMQRLAESFDQIDKLETIVKSSVLLNLPDVVAQLEQLLRKLPDEY